MARDIQIPFGPDKTNGAGFDPLAPEGAAEPEVDPFAEPPMERYANVDERGAGASAASGVPVIDVPAISVEPQQSDGPAPSPASAAGIPEPASAISDEEAAAQGMDAMQMSILALKDSIGQGRELKAREKELEELSEALAADHEELADRENILANFDQVAGEQDAIINDRTARREARKVELSQASTQLDETTDALERMREYHSTQMQPLETELGHARATADQAKNDERSRKSELNAAEAELRRAGDGDANAMAVAQHRQVQAAYDEARRRSDEAKAHLAEVQRVSDDAHAQIEEEEGPLERQIEDLTHRTEKLKGEIGELGEEISAARKRRQYCETVYRYPEETARMRSEVEAAEATAAKMDAANDVLRGQLAESKQKARKAKVALGILIAVIVVAIIAFIVVSGR